MRTQILFIFRIFIVVSLRITGFRPGSVLTDYEVTFSNNSVPSDGEIRSALINGSSNITGFDIDAGSIMVQDAIGTTTTIAPVTTMAVANTTTTAASTTTAAPATTMAAASTTTAAPATTMTAASTTTTAASTTTAAPATTMAAASTTTAAPATTMAATSTTTAAPATTSNGASHTASLITAFSVVVLSWLLSTKQ
ncbi:uncharacterized protein KZ484_008963 [Pholidichthys leucotaenia]